MKSIVVAVLTAFTLSAFTALAADEAPAAPEKKTPSTEPKSEKTTASKDEVAIIKTSAGSMVIAFWPDVAPKTVENFKKLAKEGFYDGTCFHRIIDGFMIQGGDPNTKDPAKESAWGQGGPGYMIKGETNNRADRRHERGVISMANSGSPDTAGSQFFICLAPAENRGMQYLNGKYTAFGKLIKGDDALTKLAQSPVKPNPHDPRHEVSWPVERVALESIKIVPADSVK